MATYEEHEQAAVDLLAPLRGRTMQPGHRLQMAQVEAILALAASIANRPGEEPPWYPPAQ
ncbi:hypothetical protein ACIOEZ_28800 [Streptomyces sp. NPDC087866]|uniref:hypothetical protein n=1 Tax=unclassified Streptomyces TaxID=2593676 RepID=UPI0033A794CF